MNSIGIIELVNDGLRAVETANAASESLVIRLRHTLSGAHELLCNVHDSLGREGGAA